MGNNRKDHRELKISGYYEGGSKVAPMLRLKGKWLEEFGFNVGEYTSVKCEDGKLIITPDYDRSILREKEQAYLDGKMKKLEAKYEENKKVCRKVISEREGCKCLC